MNFDDEITHKREDIIKQNPENEIKNQKEKDIETKKTLVEITEEDEILNFDTFFLIRSFIVLIAITFIALNTVYGFALPNTKINCIDDKIFNLTQGINAFFKENVSYRHALIILSSLFIDFSVIFTTIHWACFGKSWRIILALIIFYGFRMLIQVKK